MDLAERLFSTRRGTILVALGAAALAGLILLVYIREYRHTTSANSAATPVLVARSLIQKGTPGTLVGKQHLYQIASVPKSALLPGAYVDPSALLVGVAASDIFPGQQLTAGEFVQTATTLETELSGTQRAMELPIDPIRTLGGQLSAGDRIDIYVSGSGIVKEILQDIPVLVSPVGGTVTVRLNAKQAALLALAVDTGKIWFTLRPNVGAPAQPLFAATPQQLLGK